MTIFLGFYLNSHAHRKIGQNRVFIIAWESSENQFGQPQQKSSTIFFKFPIEEIVYPRLGITANTVRQPSTLLKNFFSKLISEKDSAGISSKLEFIVRCKLDSRIL